MNKPLLLTAALLLAPLASPALAGGVVAARSEIGFSVKQMGVSVSGVFRRYNAQVSLDEKQPEKSSAQIEVEIASLSTGAEEGDAIALEKEWLDAKGFPKATFRSSSVKALGGGRYEARGTLSIKGKPRELAVPFTYKDGVATGSFQLLRADFGIGGGEWNEGDMVSPEVGVRFRLALAP